MNANEYLVTTDYHNEEFDFDLVEGDVVSEKSFDKSSLVMVERLVGRGILRLIDTDDHPPAKKAKSKP